MEKGDKASSAEKKMCERQCVGDQMQGSWSPLLKEVHRMFLRMLIGDLGSRDSTEIIPCRKL